MKFPRQPIFRLRLLPALLGAFLWTLPASAHPGGTVVTSSWTTLPDGSLQSRIYLPAEFLQKALLRPGVRWEGATNDFLKVRQFLSSVNPLRADGKVIPPELRHLWVEDVEISGPFPTSIDPEASAILEAVYPALPDAGEVELEWTLFPGAFAPAGAKAPGPPHHGEGEKSHAHEDPDAHADHDEEVDPRTLWSVASVFPDSVDASLHRFTREAPLLTLARSARAAPWTLDSETVPRP